MPAGSMPCSIPPQNHAQPWPHRTDYISVAVSVGLVRPAHLATNVVCLILGHLGKLRAECGKMQPCHLLVELLREQVHLVFVTFVLLRVFQEIELRKHLICERARHDEGWVTSGAAEVEETS